MISHTESNILTSLAQVQTTAVTYPPETKKKPTILEISPAGHAVSKDEPITVVQV